MKKQAEMTIMCGLPGCSKSTWIKKHNKNAVIVELDWIRKEIFGHQFHYNAEQFVIGMAKSIARILCSQDKDVIIDSTGLTIGIRNEWVNMAKEYGYKTKIVFIDVPIEECKKRNAKRENPVPDEVYERMEGIFQIPRKQKSEDLILSSFYDKADKVTIIKG
jgi:predicted kinase